VKKVKKYKKKERKLPKLNPLPTYIANLRKYFAPMHAYARFYGNFVTSTGKTRRFSFQVILPFDLNGYDKYRVVRSVCNRRLQKEITLHNIHQQFLPPF